MNGLSGKVLTGCTIISDPNDICIKVFLLILSLLSIRRWTMVMAMVYYFILAECPFIQSRTLD